MNKVYKLGTVADLKLSMQPTFFAGTLLIFACLTALLTLSFSLGEAIVGGLLATLLYWVADIIHNAGHAIAARQTGHPMRGIHFGVMWVFGVTTYDKDEPELPAAVHIKRALGGPILSFVAALLSGLVAVLIRPNGGLPFAIITIFSLLNLLVFTIGALLPLGFTDGSTLLRYWGER